VPSFNTTPELSAAELCRLQTFLDGLSFDCSQADIQKLLGNAVPSLLVEVLARAIRVQLLDCSPSRGALKLMPPVRSPAPPPEPIARVPSRFRQYIGDHADHPGEGQGAGAVRRRSQKETSAFADA
jgi:DNA (cytosine-5)-methyltransferase 1